MKGGDGDFRPRKWGSGETVPTHAKGARVRPPANKPPFTEKMLQDLRKMTEEQWQAHLDTMKRLTYISIWIPLNRTKR